MQNANKKLGLALLSTFILILGMFLGFKFHEEIRGFGIKSKVSSIEQIMRLIERKYVDSVNVKDIEQQAIEDILAQLDPHSVYIPAEDLQKANEALVGNFEGIGIEFYLLNDTIYVVTAISGGPSEQAGIKAGDKIIKVNDKIMAGKKISNQDVTGTLRGEAGSKVKLSILRKGKKGLLDFNITRGKIPVHSVDVSYMASPGVGYIKVSSFGSTTYDEFFEALKKLKEQGLESLILDLRGNSGGYLNTAIMICDEFLEDKKLIVYTKGKSSPKREEFATMAGNFEKGKLIVMVDEGSASASEIVAGAVQDWDRGIILGRRSFGKGLVQEQAILNDGSSLRLTVARYYTPTGRCIQKPYKDGIEAYQTDVYNRFVHGELSSADSMKKDTLETFKTPSGKIVYGGGGISPDVFVPIDTSDFSIYYSRLISEGLLSEFIYAYNDQNKEHIGKLKNFEAFDSKFQVSDRMLNDLIIYASKKGLNPTKKDLSVSGNSIKIQMKALIARIHFGNEGYYRTMKVLDNGILKAVELLSL